MITIIYNIFNCDKWIHPISRKILRTNKFLPLSLICKNCVFRVKTFVDYSHIPNSIRTKHPNMLYLLCSAQSICFLLSKCQFKYLMANFKQVSQLLLLEMQDFFGETSFPSDIFFINRTNVEIKHFLCLFAGW